MKKAEAIHRAGGHKALADLLGITLSAISQWKGDVPKSREWQLRALKPDWFITPQPKSRKAKVAA